MARNRSHKSSAAARQSSNPISKLKKDPGVPKLNLKHKQIQKIAEREAKLVPPDGMNVDSGPSSQTLAGLAASSRFAALSEKVDAEDEDSPYMKLSVDPTVAAHAYQFRKVLETADVILQVLDARDPLGCRSKIVEEEVLRSGGDKKIILVLNKTDLVPKENVLAWLTYLRHDFPTIPFKSSTQQQRSNLSSNTSSKSSSRGAPHLLHILKTIRPAHSSITVGVLGPPNVGKSSLINSIRRERVCTVGAKPGETRALKEVAVERGIKVIDSPGIVWGDAGDSDGKSAFRNVWSLEGLEDPVVVVEGIVSRVPPETLQQMYGTPPFRDALELLMMIALVRGKLGKGGKPDVNSAALTVVHDWNIGKIPFHTVPPAVHPSMVSREPAPVTEVIATTEGMAPEPTPLAERAAAYATTSIVTEWGKAFDLEGLWDAADHDVLDEEVAPVDEIEMETEDAARPPINDLSANANNPEADCPDIDEAEMRSVSHSGRAPSRAGTLSSHARKERRPPKKPRERTQRLAPKGLDEELALVAVTMSRKKVKDEAKRKRKEERRAAGLVEEDIAMS